MPIKTVRKITSWSYSRFSQYNKCPASAKYKFIDKLPEPSNEAMTRGNEIHKLAENYTKGLIKTLPPELIKFKEEFKELKASKAIVEETWAFTKEWMQTTWNDWNNCWLRVKSDAACVDGTDLYAIDHKTGKPRDGYEDQLHLTATAGMLKFPHVKKVVTQLWYLDAGEMVEKTYDAKDVAKMQKDWDKRTTPMLNDTRFAPNPGNHCRWCHFSKSKGGPCKF